MNRIYPSSFLLCLILLMAGFSTAIAQQSVIESGRSHARQLAAPEMQGRGYQNDGHLLAARYIADQYAQLGLKPVPGVGNGEFPYYQQFSFGTNLITDIDLVINGVKMEDGVDYIASANSGRGKLDEQKVVRIGYGLPDDYSSKIKGKIVVIEGGLPAKYQKNSALREKYKDFRYNSTKVAMAHRAGAAGVIFIVDKLTASFSPVPVEFPVVEVLRESLPKKKIKTAALLVEAKLTKIRSQNVIGMVEGKEHPDSAIIISAHYDHLGRMGDAIFYGGNDNASGTAMLLTMAEHYSKPEHRPDYSVVFIGFGAEEAGLVGSKHYVKESPAFPLEKTAFVLNLDLMANGDEGLTAVAGADFPAHRDLLRMNNEELQAVPLVKAPRNRPNSDHYHFVMEGVPAIFIFTLGGPPHYHDVNDTYEHMVFSRFTEVQQLLLAFVDDLMDPTVQAPKPEKK